ncbi:isochorismatase family protein [Mycetocola reblochoni]|uniref:Isochorismatase of siderophore biosynthesis n=2 Tax=Mycetocola reblochoni TaxID=331618 RepID=A0A1R4IC42_9MICO|nr:isochorismatase family protein [Mycetocola reblochoni]RLP69140.1 isochorismatase family protein [Mycetocola reblochoni]SJN17405.1 Isochorismatase of siderophore biosynthesis [Mycetocola reblochoni REB411]
MPLPRISPYELPPVDTTQNRTSWRIEPDRAVLLVHDMQRHFVDAFVDAPEAQISTAITAIRALLRRCRAQGIPVVYTAQPPGQDQADRGLLTDLWGPGLATPESARIVDELEPAASDDVLTKWRYSAFHRSDLAHRMRNRRRDQLIVTGVYAHIGCLTTALDAFMQNIEVFFAADAQADFSLEEHEMAIRYVAGRCGQVTTAAGLLDDLDPQPAQAAGAAL